MICWNLNASENLYIFMSRETEAGRISYITWWNDIYRRSFLKNLVAITWYGLIFEVSSDKVIYLFALINMKYMTLISPFIGYFMFAVAGNKIRYLLSSRDWETWQLMEIWLVETVIHRMASSLSIHWNCAKHAVAVLAEQMDRVWCLTC